MTPRVLAVFAPLMLMSAPAASAQSDGSQVQTVEAVFSDENRNGLVMDVEAAFAQAQAEYGVIPEASAQEIADKASIRYAPLDNVAEEYARVRHRMIALLNVWRRSLSPAAGDALHKGVTTVDVYDTVRILQLRQTIALLRRDMIEAEGRMVAIAAEHRDTLMVGRTLGQHALPITFGKKVSVWAAANRRNIDRLDAADCRLSTLGVLRGAVGTHLGLGPDGPAIEAEAARRLGLGPVTPADWHGLRDVFGEYAAVLAITARTNAKIGREVFDLQTTDIGEVHERRPQTALSSSTMPHKRNPSRSEALMHYGRTIPALATVLLDDIANSFERDNTSRPNSVLEDISRQAAGMTGDLNTLLGRIEVDPQRMRANLDRTGGMVMAQRIVFAVEGDLGKPEAEERVAAAARKSLADGTSFQAALLQDRKLAPLLEHSLDALLDPATYVGASGEQVDRTIAWLSQQPNSPTCR